MSELGVRMLKTLTNEIKGIINLSIRKTTNKGSINLQYSSTLSPTCYRLVSKMSLFDDAFCWFSDLTAKSLEICTTSFKKH